MRTHTPSLIDTRASCSSPPCQDRTSEAMVQAASAPDQREATETPHSAHRPKAPVTAPTPTLPLPFPQESVLTQPCGPLQL